MTDEQLSALLRLKRYEQPPPGYFDQLLHDIHRRQRAELLRRPLWRIAAERVQTFFGEHSMGGLSYAGAMAGVMIFGLATIGLFTTGEIESGSVSSGKIAGIQRPSAPQRLITLQPPASGLELRPTTTAQPGLPVSARLPRYVIDARPAVYEPSLKF